MSAELVTPTTQLLAQGMSRYQIECALRRGELVRVRRGWVATPDADPDLVAAARRGVVLTCLTQARRLGLWVHEHDRPHVAAPPHAGRAGTDGLTVHWHTPPIPRLPGALEDPVENVLVAVARCQPYERALATWESALRTGLVRLDEMARLPLPPAARRLCREASPFADSGLESYVVSRLRWLRLPLTQQAWLLGRPVDLLVGERLVVQIDGNHHVGAQRTADVEHDARLALLGYHVVRVTYAQVIDDWIAVQRRIMTAVGQGLHRG